MGFRTRFMDAIGNLVGRHKRDMTAMRRRAESAESERDSVRAEFEAYRVDDVVMAFEALRTEHAELLTAYSTLKSDFEFAVSHVESLVPAEVTDAPETEEPAAKPEDAPVEEAEAATDLVDAPTAEAEAEAPAPVEATETVQDADQAVA